MRITRPTSIRTKLTFWYVSVLAILLLVYVGTVFVFQYATLTKQIFHDEVQDVVTVEGLLYFDGNGVLQLRQDYYSRPQSHLLIDRLMEVRDLSGMVLYRSSTLQGMSLGGPIESSEGDASFNDRVLRLADGRHVFVISHIHGMAGRTVLIRLGYSLVPLRDTMWQFLLRLLVALPLTLGIAALVGQTIAKRALHPLGEMTAHAELITANNLHDRLAVTNPDDELGHMARVFNLLLQRLEQAFQQLQRFTADAAHELRTPLASLRAVGEVSLENGDSPEACREAISSILEETNRLNETVNSLLLLARAEVTQANADLFAITELTNEVLTLLGVLIEERHIRVVQDDALGAEKALVRADRSLLRIAILNVLHNALKFSPEGASLRLAYEYADSEQKAVRLTVQDEGEGIAPGEHERVFERFFRSSVRSSPTESGSGLGLPIARLVIERAGGTIRFDAIATLGALCVIELPCLSA